MRPIRVEPTTVECVWTPLPGRAWFAVASSLIVLAIVACAFLADEAWFDPLRLAPIEAYALDSKDSTVFAVARARSPARAQADVILLGSSTARESLWDEALWRQAGDLQVAKLVSSAQLPIESLFLLEQQPLNRGQLVILSVGISQLVIEDKGARLQDGIFLQNPQSFIAAHPDLFPTENDWLRQRLQTLAGARRLLGRYLHVALPRQLSQHIYDAPAVQSLESYYTAQASSAGIRQQRNDLRQGLETNGKKHLPAYLSAVDAIARYCARHGATLVVLESPYLERDLQTTFALAWPAYQRGMEALADRRGVRYLNMSRKVALSQRDFIDVVHIGPSGRDAWSAQLLREIAGWRAAGT